MMITEFQLQQCQQQNNMDFQSQIVRKREHFRFEIRRKNIEKERRELRQIIVLNSVQEKSQPDDQIAIYLEELALSSISMLFTETAMVKLEQILSIQLPTQTMQAFRNILFRFSSHDECWSRELVDSFFRLLTKAKGKGIFCLDVLENAARSCLIQKKIMVYQAFINSQTFMKQIQKCSKLELQCYIEIYNIFYGEIPCISPHPLQAYGHSFSAQQLQAHSFSTTHPLKTIIHSFYLICQNIFTYYSSNSSIVLNFLTLLSHLINSSTNILQLQIYISTFLTGKNLNILQLITNNYSLDFNMKIKMKIFQLLSKLLNSNGAIQIFYFLADFLFKPIQMELENLRKEIRNVDSVQILNEKLHIQILKYLNALLYLRQGRYYPAFQFFVKKNGKTIFGELYQMYSLRNFTLEFDMRKQLSILFSLVCGNMGIESLIQEENSWIFQYYENVLASEFDLAILREALLGVEKILMRSETRQVISARSRIIEHIQNLSVNHEDSLGQIARSLMAYIESVWSVSIN